MPAPLLPWVGGPRYVLIGSPLSPDATNFPVRASFVPWLGTVLTERLVGEPGQVIAAAPGAQLPRPRWADAMEFVPEAARNSLGEGDTPLLRSRSIGPSAGLKNLYFKLETVNPSGSYKDRFAALHAHDYHATRRPCR